MEANPPFVQNIVFKAAMRSLELGVLWNWCVVLRAVGEFFVVTVVVAM